MSRETIDEERREQKINQDLVNLSEEESNQDLYEEMDTLCEDLKSDEKSESLRKLEDIDDEPNDGVSACPEELPMNIESDQENYGVAQKSDIQAMNDEKSEPPAEMESLDKSGHWGEEQSEKGTVAKYWLLFTGIVLVGIGMFGVIGLRLNIVQTYLLSIDNPFPGIGSMEPMGHVGSIIPFTIGIVAILVWGFLSDKGEESEEHCKSVEKENAPNAKPMEPTGHVGAVISLGMGIISLLVWGLLPGKAEVTVESDGEDDSVKKADPIILKSKDRGMFVFEPMSSHKYI